MAASEVAVPATAIAWSTWARTSWGMSSARTRSTSSASASSSAGVGGSEWRWRSVWRTEPMRVDTWKVGSLAGVPDDVFGAAAADVEHERRVVGGPSVGGAEEGEPGLLVA